jgi:hypothetical protein
MMTRGIRAGWAWGVALCLGLISSPAYAAGVAGLSRIKDVIDGFNSQLMLVGASLVVTGIIWAGLAITMGLGGAARAVIAIIAGLIISFAPQIAAMFT